MPIRQSSRRHSIALKLALLLPTTCVLCVMLAGAWLARSEAERLRELARENIAQQAIELARLVDLHIDNQKRLALSANQTVSEQAFAAPTGDVALPPLQPDGSRRQDDEVSAAFIAAGHQSSEQVAGLFQQTAVIWRVLTPTLRDSLFNFYFISEEQFIRIFPPQWALEIEAEHDFQQDVFYNVATPEKNPSRKPVWTPMYYDDVWHRWMTSLIVPVYVGGQFRGITGNDLVLDELFTTIDDYVQSHDDIDVLLVNEHGELITDSHQLSVLLSQQAKMNTLLTAQTSPLLPETEVAKWLSGHVQDYRLDQNGHPYYASPQRLDSIGWYLVLVGDKTFVNERIVNMQLQLFWIALLIGVLTGLLVYQLFSRIFLRPLRQLATASADIAEGHWDTPLPPEGKDEIGLLNHSFADMVSEVRRLVQGLESEIHEKQLAERDNRKLLQAVEQAGNGVVIVDRQLRIEYANQRFLEMTGFNLQEMLKKPVGDVLPLESALLATMDSGNLTRAAQTERQWPHKREGTTTVLQTLSPLFDGDKQITHYLISGENITELKRSQAEVERLAFQDALTGLDNRHLFRRQLQASLERVRRTHARAALIYIDLDYFKEINDSLGHDAGDEVLKEVSKRLSSAIRRDDSCARLGGDEFAIILNNVGTANDVAQIAEDLLARLETPVQLHGRLQPIAASLGVTLIPDDGDEAVQVMKNADLALYKAKEAGRHCYRFFTVELQHAAEQRHEMDLRLRQALNEQQFLLYWQPKISLQDFRVSGFEALIRWQYQSSILTPDKFLHIAEDNGLIQEIGRWVLQQAMREQHALSSAIGHPVQISVNLSPRQFADTTLIADCRRSLQQSGLSPSLLELEITENSLIHDINEATKMLGALKQLGVRVAIDDFGIGHCSLSYLRQLPVNTLKIDRSFVRDLPLDQSNNAIVAAVLAMAANLRLDVVAEGIETSAQQNSLVLGGCQYGQGFLYGRPMPLAQIESWYGEFKQRFQQAASIS
ncbi:bifunctional diguanylate cyclase/phosphodiesterase [Permianibacter aggregans]|uniref:PAS domain S-box-containing protein/diguanylate cyclase (GGDEF)-like protein n=1 Tax=Permianibacter aggregans TaxID=1510150 RepID=A0A4R6UVP4_9GAMM|nr:EAL domain-containing protein [Permianibacter aggregans]QGX39353.1 EAL domain-containing protein [Permianibacter aggregans]TDQ49913.1 PAS domain S-box-containing protein/diguanylate cyclase (GGDEF)-like protein [Permianibacter aggregans]